MVTPDSALCWPGGQLDRRDLTAAVERMAARLSRHDDAIVAIRAGNTPATVVLVLACLRRGRPVALLWPAWTASQVAAARSALGKAVELDERGEPIWEAGRQAPTRHNDHTALILFTSGSTGAPRAVELSREHLDRVTQIVVEVNGIETAAEQLIFAPLAHALGLCCQLLPGLRAGLTIRLAEGLKQARRLIEQGQVSGALGGVPAHWEALLRYARFPAGSPEAITHVVSAGAPLPVSLRHRLREAFPAAVLTNGYGLTEAPRAITLSSRDPRFFGAATGRAVPGTEPRIEDGELLLGGPSVMIGYLGAPEATAERLTGGWLRTGDAARMDSGGMVTVLGRLDDSRNVGGELVSLTEIDQELRCLDGVRDAAADTDEADGYGTTLIAFLVGGRELADLRVGDVRETLAARLPWSRVPRRFFLLDELPRTPNGKLRRRLLPARLPEAVELHE